MAVGNNIHHGIVVLHISLSLVVGIKCTGATDAIHLSGSLRALFCCGWNQSTLFVVADWQADSTRSEGSFDVGSQCLRLRVFDCRCVVGPAGLARQLECGFWRDIRHFRFAVPVVSGFRAAYR